MIKKVILFCLVVGILLLPVPAFAGKDYVAERFDVDIVVDTDGSMQVTETISFRFMGGPFTYVYRELEKTRTDGISFISAELDGHPLPVNGESAIDWVEVEDGDALNVTWHFLPTTDQTRIYTLTYEVTGVVRKDDTDIIVWYAIPQDHDYRAQGVAHNSALPNRGFPDCPTTAQWCIELSGGKRWQSIDPDDWSGRSRYTAHLNP